MKILFLHISSSKVDQLLSNQEQNDTWPILHISPNTFHWLKYLISAIFVSVCLSVCLSVCHATPSFSQNWNTVKSSHFTGRLLLIGVNGKVILRSKLKGQGQQQQKRKNSFHAYLDEIWIDLHQTKTRMIFGPFYTNHLPSTISPVETRFFMTDVF